MMKKPSQLQRNEKGGIALIVTIMMSVAIFVLFGTYSAYFVSKSRYQSWIKESYKMNSVMEQAAKSIQLAWDKAVIANSTTPTSPCNSSFMAANGATACVAAANAAMTPAATCSCLAAGTCPGSCATSAQLCYDNTDNPSVPYCFYQNGFNLTENSFEFKLFNPLENTKPSLRERLARLSDYAFYNFVQIKIPRDSLPAHVRESRIASKIKRFKSEEREKQQRAWVGPFLQLMFESTANACPAYQCCTGLFGLWHSDQCCWAGNPACDAVFNHGGGLCSDDCSGCGGTINSVGSLSKCPPPPGAPTPAPTPVPNATPVATPAAGPVTPTGTSGISCGPGTNRSCFSIMACPATFPQCVGYTGGASGAEFFQSYALAPPGLCSGYKPGNPMPPGCM